MKTAIIGAGNMGGAIARGMAKGTIIAASDITVADRSEQQLNKLKADFPDLQVTTDNNAAVAGADIVILAVKPWLAEVVLKDIKLTENQMLVSIAAGVTNEQLTSYVNTPAMPIFRMMPNIAISEMQSTTLIASQNATKEQETLLLDIFNEMGLAMLIAEKDMAATMAMTSCGIAFVFKYIQAAMQAGVELGIYPKDGMKMVAQSVKGAAELILKNETHPSVEIDKVCTPGGTTIKGINTLDHEGFPAAIIKAVKASAGK